MPEEDGCDRCRCCDSARETQVHLHRCSALWPIWKVLRKLIGATWKNVKPCYELTFFGMTEQGEFLPLGLRAFHAVLWKMILIEFSLVGINPGTVFKSRTIIPSAIQRLQTRINAMIVRYKRRLVGARRKGTLPPSASKTNEILHPLVSISGDAVQWHPGWTSLCLDYSVEV